MNRISEHIKNMKFRKRILGGVDEADVWRQIESLHQLYQEEIALQNKKHIELINSLKEKYEKKY
ncbi:MAG: hypothetical protein Q4D88_04810 [Anaerococcus sp.]|nr:hypothetical protein [Anaerococcus sp.]